VAQRNLRPLGWERALEGVTARRRRGLLTLRCTPYATPPIGMHTSIVGASPISAVGTVAPVAKAPLMHARSRAYKVCTL